MRRFDRLIGEFVILSVKAHDRFAVPVLRENPSR
jgi:hypothetical protein